ncbi:PMT-domain-containing protein [Neoconidiobolus thromboides FSU 785]|nr:PMT-domain-containing protein [Neoconidiobolus thromboides FSU 785]
MNNQLQKRRTGQNTTEDHHTSLELNYTGEDKGDVDYDYDKVKSEVKFNDKFLKPELSLKEEDNFKFRNNRYVQFYIKNKLNIWLTILTLLSMFTRYYRIGAANKPIWDEVHFGKFGSHYLRGTFYHDVHPPLGKMLVGVGGKIAGYDGTFKFEGGNYPEGMNYTFMRWFHANFGVALVPLSFLTAKKLNMSDNAALLAASMVLFDNGLTVISRFILLDSMLLCFIAMSLYYFVAFHACQKNPFTRDWYYNLIMLGISLGLASSVKWIGFFAVALVGLYTIESLYQLLSEPNFSWYVYAKHWITRAFGLIFMPVFVYLLCFKIHFKILNNSGPGDATMDTLFQARLNRNELWKSPPELVFMGNATIRSGSLDGGLLHSHPHNYPEGSKEQQITCYGHKDSNNDWTIKHAFDDLFNTTENNEVTVDANTIKEINPKVVRSGNLIKLYHVETKKNLRVQKDHDAIITGKRAYEVSASGDAKTFNKYEIWKIEIYDDLLDSNKPGVIQTLSTRFQLRNPELDCLLAKDFTTLPDWGYSQSEVYCVKDGKSKNEETLWNIESLSYEGLPPAEKRKLPETFYRDFIRLNRAMWSTNNALTPDEDKFDHLTSHALDWPLMRRGIRMCGWGDNEIKFYMLGNPLVWWGSTFGLLLFVGLTGYYCIRMKRNIKEWVKDDWENYIFAFKAIVGGWLLQYLPFFLMGRVLYVHHYFPSLYIACLALPYTLDLLVQNKTNNFKNKLFFSIIIMICLTFIYFAPMTFGMTFPSEEFKSRNWLKTWHLFGAKEDE